MRIGFPILASDPLLQIEAALVLTVAVIAAIRPKLLLRLPGPNVLARPFLRRPRLAPLAVALVTLALHALVAPWLPARQPLVHDEFSYLLAAETFLSGRIANPPHPMWRHWESPHVIHQPTYSSMYPPAQGVMLALGRAATGTYLAWPWIGSAALAGLICWMLALALPLRWAILGGLIAGIRIGVFSYWANSYWGGLHAALAGVLAVAAAARLQRRPTIPNSALLGLGIGALALSRPYEGFFLTLALAPQICRKGIRPLIPAGLVAAAALASLAAYNRFVTGDPLTMGYQINMQRYGMAVFPWQSTTPTDPPWAESLRRYYDSQKSFIADCFSDAAGYIANRLLWADRLWAFYLGPLLTVPLFLIPVLRRRGAVILLVFALPLMLNAWVLPHYAAPALGVLYLLLTHALRHMALGPGGRAFVTGLLWTCILMVPVRLWIDPGKSRTLEDEFALTWHYTSAGNQARAALERDLEAQPGSHLVLVRYPASYNVHYEWVYNRAAIDSAKVVWAFDLGLDRNRELLKYFATRKAWLLIPDDTRPALSPHE